MRRHQRLRAIGRWLSLCLLLVAIAATAASSRWEFMFWAFRAEEPCIPELYCDIESGSFGLSHNGRLTDSLNFRPRRLQWVTQQARASLDLRARAWLSPAHAEVQVPLVPVCGALLWT